MGSNNFKNKHLVFVILFSLLVFDFLIIPLNCEGEGSGDYPPPDGSDWVIENDTYVTNETIFLNGNLNVTNNSTLTLNNVTLLINSSSDIHGIYVDWGETLNIFESDITALNGLFTFDVNGNMCIERSRISRMIGGIYINFGDVLIANSTIFDNLAYGIVCLGEPTITNNLIHSNYGGILTGFGSAALILNNTITSNEWGVICNSVSYATLFGNDISNNTLGGINVELGYFQLHNNTIASNGGFGIRSDHASINATNNTIYDNQRWGIYLFGAPIFQENNNFEKDGKYNKDGDIIQEWEILVQVLYNNDETPHEVHIVIYDDLGNLMYEGDTIGNARTVVLQEYEYLNNGSILEHSPFTITASKGGYKNTTTVEVRDNMIVTIYLDFEPERDKTDYQFPLWGIVVVSGIWLIVAIMIIIGLFSSIRERRRGH